jgi:transcriptional regulator with GAF, ATPase, and Fis domain
MVFKAVSLHKAKMLSLDPFKSHIRDNRDARNVEAVSMTPSSYPQWLVDPTNDSFPTLKQAQKMLIQLAMKRAGNSQSIAAHLLGITPQALSKRLKKSGK